MSGEGADEGLSIGELSQRTGCPIETIRYYERIGIMLEPPRTAGRHRVYGGRDLRRLTLICRARELGFPLDQVRSLLAMAANADVPRDQVRALTASHLDEVRGKITRLLDVEHRLSRLVGGCPEGGGADCPIIAWLDGTASPPPGAG